MERRLSGRTRMLLRNAIGTLLASLRGVARPVPPCALVLDGKG